MHTCTPSAFACPRVQEAASELVCSRQRTAESPTASGGEAPLWSTKALRLPCWLERRRRLRCWKGGGGQGPRHEDKVRVRRRPKLTAPRGTAAAPRTLGRGRCYSARTLPLRSCRMPASQLRRDAERARQGTWPEIGTPPAAGRRGAAAAPATGPLALSQRRTPSSGGQRCAALRERGPAADAARGEAGEDSDCIWCWLLPALRGESDARPTGCAAHLAASCGRPCHRRACLCSSIPPSLPSLSPSLPLSPQDRSTCCLTHQPLSHNSTA
jgi:hypothetical protein